MFFIACVCVFFLFCFVLFFFHKTLKKGFIPPSDVLSDSIYSDQRISEKKKKKKKKKRYETKTVINIEGHLVKIETFIFRLKTGQRKSNPDRTTNNKLQKIN